jgi:hypothetical protein
MVLLNFENPHLDDNEVDKWNGLVSIVAKLHDAERYTSATIAPIHQLVNMIYISSSSATEQQAWLQIFEMLKHPVLTYYWNNLLISSAYRSVLTLDIIKRMASYDPSVSLLTIHCF